tara:strand:+ start:103 stop:342 length:240 start_codon:yes stop_codon:yes gene_type:complete
MSDTTTGVHLVEEEVQGVPTIIELSERQKELFSQLMQNRAKLEEQMSTMANAIVAGEDIIGEISIRLDMEAGNLTVTNA